ncbi:hypothetical protein AX16_006275 [Volvariella volvacea WC 439]|nr:hypothetical protein AX16_006275 [Volvariella volvacea WC 439]
MTKQQKDTQKTLDRAIALFHKQQDRNQQLEEMLNQVLMAVNSQLVNPTPFPQPTNPDALQVKMEEWEKKLDQILQESAPPPPPPPTTTTTINPSTPKIPAPPLQWNVRGRLPSHQPHTTMCGHLDWAVPRYALGRLGPLSAYPLTALVYHAMG